MCSYAACYLSKCAVSLPLVPYLQVAGLAGRSGLYCKARLHWYACNKCTLTKHTSSADMGPWDALGAKDGGYRFSHHCFATFWIHCTIHI